MDGFYEVLQKDQGLDEEDIGIIKDVFNKEKIKVKQCFLVVSVQTANE